MCMYVHILLVRPSGWATKTPPTEPSGSFIFRGEHSLACAYLCSYMSMNVHILLVSFKWLGYKDTTSEPSGSFIFRDGYFQG